MKKTQQVGNQLLWAAAVVASIILNDNSYFSVFLLPGLAVTAILYNSRCCGVASNVAGKTCSTQ